MALAPDTIAAIAQRLAASAGLELPAWVVDARATARIAVLGCDPADYVALIDGPRGAGELAALIEAVRVGESRLFRHRPQIDVLASVIAPALRARGRRAIRVWSAGCAAGEEPYTLAIVLSRALPGCAITIAATDVSGDALARARTASYPRAALDHVPEAYRDCFVGDGDAIRVAPEIAALVRFDRANLLDGATPRDCDLVWCRNVLIYFTADARRRAIDRLVTATAPGGFVFVGYSESLRDIAGLDAQRAGDTVYYVRRDDASASAPPRPRPSTPSGLPPAPPSPSVRRTPWPSAAGRIPDAAGRIPNAAGRMPDAADRTPPPMLYPPVPPDTDTLALSGQPTAAYVIAELSARLALPGLRALTIDVDGAELLGDDLAPVLRRARAAAGTAGIAIEIRATRAGTLRWLARHGLAADDSASAGQAPRAPRTAR
jgi:chemotaxis methyl-accepting protein methylase